MIIAAVIVNDKNGTYTNTKIHTIITFVNRNPQTTKEKVKRVSTIRKHLI